MAAAVAEQELLIGGKWVGAKSGKEVEQTNPYTEETVGRAAAAGTDDVDAAGEAAQGAPRPSRPRWRRRGAPASPGAGARRRPAARSSPRPPTCSPSAPSRLPR